VVIGYVYGDARRRGIALRDVDAAGDFIPQRHRRHPLFKFLADRAELLLEVAAHRTTKGHAFLSR